jgi:hypothetical protein
MGRIATAGSGEEIAAFCPVLFGLALRAGSAGGVETVDEDQAFADPAARERHVQGARKGASQRMSSSSSISVAGKNA